MGERSINLLQSFYASSSYQQTFEHYPPYFRELEIASNFFVVTDASVDIRMELVYRIPGATAQDQPVKVFINGKEHSSLPSADSWNRVLIQAPASCWKEDVNTVSIQWPVHVRPVALKEDALLSEIVDFVNPVFGEIHQFTASNIH